MVRKMSSGVAGHWFAIPGVGAFSSCFMPFIEPLGSREVGLQAIELIDLFRQSPQLNTLREFGSVIRSLIAAEVGTDPCTIVGHSFGARLAFEVGLQLADLGTKSNVIMVDALPADFEPSSMINKGGPSIEWILRWFLSALSTNSSVRLDDIPDDELIQRVVASRIMRHSEIDDLTAIVRRQILSHHSYCPSDLVDHGMEVTVLLAAEGGLALRNRADVNELMGRYASKWHLGEVPGNHTTVLQYAGAIVDRYQYIREPQHSH